MKGKKYSVAIAGATGAVGQKMIEVLIERKFPVGKMRYLASERSVGKTLDWKGEKLKVELLSKDSFKGVDIALFSAGGDRSLEFAPAAAKAGAIVVDNSSAFRMDKKIPLVVPEINPKDVGLYKKTGIIANPNCTTIIMAVPLKPLADAAGGIKRIVVSTYQSTSGAGASAMAELVEQVNAYVRGKPMLAKVFPHPIAFNLFPHVDKFLDNGYSKEEMKMVHETHKIFHDKKIKISATTVRVPVLTSHSESIWVQFRKPMSPKKAQSILAKASKNARNGIKLVDEPHNKIYPMPKDASDQDLVLVGRIREDLTTKGGLTLFVSGDQLRKGAATNAVQIAEILIEKYI